MLSVCTSSTEAQLAKLSDLLLLLGATASSSGMDRALDAATEWVERHVTNSAQGRLRREVVQETLSGLGGLELMVSRLPLWRVQRLFDATDTCEATEYCSTDFRVEDEAAGLITMVSDVGFASDDAWQWFLDRSPLPRGRTRPWLVVYEAGWQLGEWSTSMDSGAGYATTTTHRTLPQDVERAVLLKAAELYQGALGGVESIKVGPLGLNYRSEAADPVVGLLAPYRRLD